jgi:hypothetical protein
VCLSTGVAQSVRPRRAKEKEGAVAEVKRQGQQPPSEVLRKEEAPITVVRLERALVFTAHVVEKYGDRYAPILERLDRELGELRRQENPRERARRILETYTRDGGAKAIR